MHSGLGPCSRWAEMGGPMGMEGPGGREGRIGEGGREGEGREGGKEGGGRERKEATFSLQTTLKVMSPAYSLQAK